MRSYSILCAQIKAECVWFPGVHCDGLHAARPVSLGNRREDLPKHLQRGRLHRPAEPAQLGAAAHGALLLSAAAVCACGHALSESVGPRGSQECLGRSLAKPDAATARLRLAARCPPLALSIRTLHI